MGTGFLLKPRQTQLASALTRLFPLDWQGQGSILESAAAVTCPVPSAAKCLDTANPAQAVDPLGCKFHEGSDVRSGRSQGGN